ncbi:hypothetical protein FX985_04691 [Pseudomonas extremaustralis]|uniref:Uncharacterized protein n=1 Tax=Pseudomonas extremaustralis TaxID=359110 RepID=A0A5M9IQF1_9PSED|nr:hypothetical protein FX985_04691 [Pseudomonas extremaustralis]
MYRTLARVLAEMLLCKETDSQPLYLRMAAFGRFLPVATLGCGELAVS